MPYVFLCLVVVNIVTLGYFVFLHQPAPTQSVVDMQNQAVLPVDFTNRSADIAPVIGTKK